MKKDTARKYSVKRSSSGTYIPSRMLQNIFLPEEYDPSLVATRDEEYEFLSHFRRGRSDKEFEEKLIAGFAYELLLCCQSLVARVLRMRIHQCNLSALKGFFGAKSSKGRILFDHSLYRQWLEKSISQREIHAFVAIPKHLSTRDGFSHVVGLCLRIIGSMSKNDPNLRHARSALKDQAYDSLQTIQQIFMFRFTENGDARFQEFVQDIFSQNEDFPKVVMRLKSGGKSNSRYSANFSNFNRNLANITRNRFSHNIPKK